MIHNLHNKLQVFIIVVTLFLFAIFTSLAFAESLLETGLIVNAKMRSLAAGEAIEISMQTTDIKAIRMAESLPDDFLPSDSNTVSTAESKNPVYIFFDNKDDAGILYFYSEDHKVVMNSNSGYILSGNLALVDISGLTDWDSSNVVSLDSAFMYDVSLSDLSPLSSWDIHNVKWLIQTFCCDASISDISALANWDTSNVKDMFGLFGDASGLQNALPLKNWITSNVTDMSYMFSGATSLEYIDVSQWDTSKVTTMKNMFQVGNSHKGNGQLREINGLGNLNVSNVTDMTCMFYGAGQMTYYDIANWDVSKVESMNHMFCDNFKLRSLDLSTWDVSSVKTMYCMFDDNRKLKTIGDVSHWNTANLIDIGGWLNDARSFVGDNYGTLDLSGWNTSNLKTTAEMFRATKICTIDLSGWTFDSIINGAWEDAGKGIYYETGNTSAGCKGLGEMFKDTSKLTKVYVSQSGMDSYNNVVKNGVSILDMWTGSKVDGFTVK